ncbi:MAG: glycosyltransferase [FCB group bacterium]|nr:glycosyltransferase [FCB group bacterium]
MTDLTQPRISIIVPVYNGGKLFRKTVASLEELTYPHEQLQIIIVNDGSTDDTGSWLSTRQLPGHFEVITHRKNRGRAATRNSGLITAGGDLLIFLDGDMRVKPDFAEQHAKALSRPGIEAVAGRMIPAPELKRTRLQRYLFEYPRRGARQFGENKHLPYQYLITGNMSITRKAADAVGLFDEEFQGYGGEDILYAYKLWKIFPGGIRYSAAAVAIDQHQYKLDELLDKYYHYGKYNLPRLLDDYPEMTPALRADYIVGNSIKRLFGDLVLNSAFFAVGKLKYKIMPYPLSNWVLRLLLIGALRKGFKHRKAI